jgi:hypothetical protein
MIWRVLMVTAALILASGAGVSIPAFAQLAKGQRQPMVEGRIVSLQGNQVMLHDGTRLIIPRYVAHPTEMEQGDTVRFTYEVKDGQKIATSIQFMDRPRDRIRP